MVLLGFSLGGGLALLFRRPLPQVSLIRVRVSQSRESRVRVSVESQSRGSRIRVVQSEVLSAHQVIKETPRGRPVKVAGASRPCRFHTPTPVCLRQSDVCLSSVSRLSQ